MTRQRLILDNGGGATLQLGDWAHMYDGDGSPYMRCARDIAAWLRDGNTDGWDGNDPLAVESEPTAEEIRNGGYTIVPVSEDMVNDLLSSGAGYNAIAVAGCLSDILDGVDRDRDCE